MLRTSFVATVLSLVVATQAQSSYTNFEEAQTNPVRLSTDGSRLFAVNTPDARVSVFDVTLPSRPVLIAEIPVGIGPVSVNPRTWDEAWVVNQVSDSVSVVSVSRGIVVDTIQVKDEPMDVVFAGQAAFVSVSRRNQINVYNALTRELIKEIPVLGGNPRALAVSEDGSKVYAAFALSGNRTTTIPHLLAPPQPPPTNPVLPPAPRTGLIVDAADPNWSSYIRYEMPDNDVVEIDSAALTVTRYYSGVGTVNLGLGVRPTTGELFVASTDARNLDRFEPQLRGHFVDNRVTRINPAGLMSFLNLDLGVDYSTLPNPAAKRIALAQPTAIAFVPSGLAFYVAAFGTDRVALVSVNGQVLSRIEVGATPGAIVNPREKRGPRGLALSGRWLYVLNRISNTLSIIDTQAQQVIREIPTGLYDPTPEVIRAGRGFLYDAKLSGNGTAACAACHVDAEMDMLAWDLGDPGGNLQFVVENGFPLPMHPMKGPMVTQTLRGLKDLDPLHWRGDRENFQAFNPAFDKLMGGSPLSDADMQVYTDFIHTIQFQPNPNQNLDRTLPDQLKGGDPNAGLNTFMNEFYKPDFKCNTCHKADPGPGTTRIIAPPRLPAQTQSLKVPHLRNVYQKLNFRAFPGSKTIDGVGLNSDGVMPNLFALLSASVFENFANDTVRKLNLQAFLLCFDTGTAPAVGYAVTVDLVGIRDPRNLQDIVTLHQQAASGNIDLIAKGTLDGQIRGLLYDPASGNWEADEAAVGPQTFLQLAAKVRLGDTLTFMGVPPGSGKRMGIDRDEDGVLDVDEL
jgi:YVTN family beta-propeller protein